MEREEGIKIVFRHRDGARLIKICRLGLIISLRTLFLIFLFPLLASYLSDSNRSSANNADSSMLLTLGKENERQHSFSVSFDL